MMGDLEALQDAVAGHAATVAELSVAAPSEELAARLDAAIRSGDAIRLALQDFKLRIGLASGRLAQLQAGFVSSLGCPPDPRIDYRG